MTGAYEILILREKVNNIIHFQMPFAVVKFAYENRVGVVPENWLAEVKGVSFIVPFENLKNDFLNVLDGQISV